MATTAVSTDGKYFLFKYGWTSKVQWAKLYTDADVLVDTQDLTLTHTNGTAIMSASADVVFDVPASTTDVAYITIGRSDTVLQTTVETTFYTKTLSTMYDFTTEGTLTIDSLDITISGASFTSAGLDLLITTGLETLGYAFAYTASYASLQDTQTLSFSASDSTGVFSLDAPLVFDIASGTTAAIRLSVGPASTAIYNRTLDSTYNFTTAGTLTVSSWELSI